MNKPDDDGWVLDPPPSAQGQPDADGWVLDPAPDKPKEYGWKGAAKAAAKDLLDNVIIGTGKSAAAARFPGSDNLNNFGNWLAGTGQAISKQTGLDDQNYGPSHSSQVHWNDPKSWVTEGPYALAETLPSAGVSMALPELRGAGFIGSQTAFNYGNNLDKRMANQPQGAEPSAGDQAAALGSTVGQAVVGRYGLKAIPGVGGNPLLAKVAPSLTKSLGTGVKAEVAKAARDVAGAAVTNAGASAASDAIDQAGRNIGTANGQSSPDWTEMANAGTVGALGGAALRGAMLPGDVVNARRMSPLGGPNAEAAADYASRLSSSGYDPRTAEGAFGAHKIAGEGLARDLGEAGTNPTGAGGVMDGSGDLARSVSDAQIKLKNGQVLPESDLSSLQSGLGPQGADLAHLLRVQNVANTVKGMGNFDTADKTHIGGISGTTIGKMLNPLYTVKKLFSHAMGGSVGALGVLEAFREGEGGLLKTVLPYLAGGGAVLSGIGKGIDTTFGLSHPTAQFMDRFGGRPFTTPTNTLPGAPPGPISRDTGGTGGPYTGGRFSDPNQPTPGHSGPPGYTPPLPIGPSRPPVAGELANYPPRPTVAQLAKQVTTIAREKAKAEKQASKAATPSNDMGGSMGPGVAPRNLGAQPEPSGVYVPPVVKQALVKLAVKPTTPPVETPSPRNLGAQPEPSPSGPPVYTPPLQALAKALKAEPKSPPVETPSPRNLGAQPEPSGNYVPPVITPQAIHALIQKAEGKAPEAPQTAQEAPQGNPTAKVKVRLKPTPMDAPGPVDKAEIDKIFAQADAQGQRGFYHTQPPEPKNDKPGSGIADQAIRNSYGGQKPGEAKVKETDDGHLIVTHRGLTVVRPKTNSMGEPIENEQRYIDEVVHHLDARANMRDEMEDHKLPGVPGLMKRMNGRSMTEEVARHELGEYTDNLPKDKQPTADRVIRKHLDRVLGTYDY